MLLKLVYIVWILFQLFLAAQLVFPFLSYLLYLIKGKKTPQAIDDKLPDYAIILTAYKDTGNIPFVLQSLLKLDYDKYLIYVVADDCKEVTPFPPDPRVILLQPEQVLASQARSHFYAMDNFKRKHDIITIIDSDNLVEPNYLHEMNVYFNAGYKAVQGVRAAKNLDTIYACIDATNELYYLFYDRKVLFNIGSSSMLSGSGMAFDVDLYRQCLEHDPAVAGADEKLRKQIEARRKDILECGWGFDKILQKEILLQDLRIAFAENVLVYDEKIAKSEQLVKQRARWNKSWFRFYKFGFAVLGRGLMRFNFNQIVYGFMLIRPPMFISLILAALIAIANIFISISATFIWCGILAVFVAGFFIALLNSKTDKRIYQALIHIPKFVFLQVLSLLKLRNARKHVATQHSYHKEIEQVKG
ncbi:glycosyltransferase [Ferruginibacter albus]|uniref:glycosyltransferase n=1 Tax=Ferruginibacter albus TaxID=2875540 RepID=UPI001CC44AB8|nr:glycosyltransferase [Ferruginibacter albus]UAY52937.1 glycosyltransferase family 2 protein [Ferruginibacter albus]